jgi:hypothetical protein
VRSARLGKIAEIKFANNIKQFRTWGKSRFVRQPQAVDPKERVQKNVCRNPV